MNFIIKDCWAMEERENQINDFLNLLGIDLYQKYLDYSKLRYTMQNVNMNLCIAYVKERYGRYLHTMGCGLVTINMHERVAFKELQNLARELELKDEVAAV